MAVDTKFMQELFKSWGDVYLTMLSDKQEDRLTVASECVRKMIAMPDVKLARALVFAFYLQKHSKDFTELLEAVLQTRQGGDEIVNELKSVLRRMGVL